MKDLTVGVAMCGSFCALRGVMEKMRGLKDGGAGLVPIMSQAVSSMDTRFGRAADIAAEVEALCGRKIINTICGAEPIGPQKMLDILLIAPCTGNTLGKLACGISDGPVTMAAKSHLRNGRPVLIGVSTNDALGAAAKNIGQLLNYKNIYFVPMGQDDHMAKPNSLAADLSWLREAIDSALRGIQLQPLMLEPK